MPIIAAFLALIFFLWDGQHQSIGLICFLAITVVSLPTTLARWGEKGILPAKVARGQASLWLIAMDRFLPWRILGIVLAAWATCMAFSAGGWLFCWLGAGLAGATTNEICGTVTLLRSKNSLKG